MFNFILCKVERRVINQLAAAHEKQLIKKGCSVHITIEEMQDPMKGAGGETVRTIKLKMRQKGADKKFLDLPVNSSFLNAV